MAVAVMVIIWALVVAAAAVARMGVTGPEEAATRKGRVGSRDFPRP